MRVISQDGTMDISYDSSSVYGESVNGRIYVRMQLCSGSDSLVTVADYSTEEKAIKVMEMLRKQYKALEVLKVLANGTAEHMEKSFNFDEFAEYNRAYRDMNVFQFPQDDEIEV